MRKRTIIATAIVGGVVATALVATAGIALANGVGDNHAARAMHTSEQIAVSDRMPAHGPGRSGEGKGTEMRNGSGPGAGMDAGLTNVASGTLTAEQKTTLSAMAEEEKLAHDLYIAFADQYGTTVFSRIAHAETRHLDAVRSLLDRYDIIDPTAGEAAGQFSTGSVQKLYDTLLTTGSSGLDAAFEAARTVEKTDIADLAAAKDGVTAPDVLAVYQHLTAGSQHHLVAFGG
jgi:hypothetical protein